MYEWDAHKNRANLAKHGVSFDAAVQIFEGPVLTRRDDRKDYGELRLISMGETPSDHLILVVVHTPRDDVRRIISARRANTRERAIYRDQLEKSEG